MEINYTKLSYYRTNVSIPRSQENIEKILQKYGLRGIRFTKYNDVGIIEFILLRDNKELMFRFKYTLPEKENHRRQVYRALFHYLKNRFLAIEYGITTIEKEFLQELVLKLPNGTTSTIKEILGDRIKGIDYENLNLLEDRK